MDIGIDVRVLGEDSRTGVGEYMYQLFRRMFARAPEHTFKLFYNASRKTLTPEIRELAALPNARLFHFKYSNRLLNASIFFLRRPTIDRLLGHVDVFFLPNLTFNTLSSDCPQVTTFHDLSFEHYPEFYNIKGRWWHKFTNPRRHARNAKHIVAVSQATKDDLKNIYHVADDKISVVHSGIDDRFLQAPTHDEMLAATTAYHLSDTYLLYVGTLEPRKNVVGLIDAYTRLRRAYPEHTLPLLLAGGKGWLYKRIFAARDASPYATDIRFLGFVDDQYKRALLTKAAAFVYPSFYEGFGFPPLEAMACGTPTIASSVSSVPEVCDAAALLVNPNKTQEITEAVHAILSDQALAGRLSKQGKERAGVFTWDRAVDQTLAVITKAA